jgi:fatty-acyl-CoA synthase
MSAMEWNFADVWEIVADRIPDEPALAQGERRVTWAELSRRADGLARFLLDAGLVHQDKVAQHLYNGPEYLESVFASFKAGLVPVNSNYRYLEDELAYLWDNSDSAAVIFHGSLAGTVTEVRPRVPRVKAWLWVDDGSGDCPDWATPYEDAVATPSAGSYVQGPWGRSADDLYLLYTGGTTGFPKGAMWRQEDLFLTSNRTQRLRYPIGATAEEAAALVTGPGPSHVPACPLMHGLGSITSFQAMSSGGSVILLTGRRFDPIELLDTVDRERAATIAIVGDAQAKPILDALDAAPGAWDLSSLRMIISSGSMFSAPVKQGLLRHSARLMLVDTLGSSESIGMASSITSAGAAAETASFRVSDETAVITEDGRFVQPGSGEQGLLSKRGNTSIGYYKDEAKTEATYRVVDGVRWLTPGDMATVESDGSIILLGRGSNCINSGGEKIFPEEVEEALKQHPAVRDVAVVGIPDDRLGEAVAAVVEAERDASPTADELVAFVRTKIASYKAPRKLLLVPSVDRLITGKNDYKRWKAYATEAPS